ncbi:MAG: hypothetical protein ABSG35_09370 [Syntrophobacteraceae bacterium]|jgi:hypothetical protein
MTNFLYAIPNFWSGVARVLDLGATLNVYNETFSPPLADYYAIKADWLAVGEDMRLAVEQFAQEYVAPKR